MDTSMNRPPATPESVWAALRELTEKQAETDRQMKQSREDYDRQMKQSREDYDRQTKQSREDYDRRIKQSHEDYDRRMINFEKTMGSWANNHGRFAEEYFFNSFEKGRRNFFGEKFDDIENDVKGIEKGFKDEYDILMTNGHSVGIVEVKFKAHENDIPSILNKVDTFRVNFPKYKNHKVYLGLATMAFYPELEQECIKQGIAVIKQVGDTVVINDEHLKAF